MLTAAVNSTSHRRANRDLSAFAKQRLMMKSFRLLPASEGPRREFKITLGLRAGYGPAGRTYDLEEAVDGAPLDDGTGSARGAFSVRYVHPWRSCLWRSRRWGRKPSRAGRHLHRRGSSAIRWRS